MLILGSTTLVSLLVTLALGDSPDPARAPTGQVTEPGDLLKEADGLEFRFSYFPSWNQMRVFVLKPPADVVEWQVSISASGRLGTLAQARGGFPFPKAGASIELPPLNDGAYDVRLVLLYAGGARREIVRAFERKRFVWEDSGLGRERIVVPPFTPLRVDRPAARVDCILREHHLDGVGLWKQSTGLQSGCLGVIHNLFHGDERILRSAMAVALTHEMRMGVDGGGISNTVRDPLLQFGYGLPDCRVWRYWDDESPVTASGAPVKLLVLARGRKAMLVIGSYGPGGEAVLRADLEALGVPADVVAVDVETGEILRPSQPGQFSVPISRHDFRLLRIEERGD
jgi:hypothetical protein